VTGGVPGSQRKFQRSSDTVATLIANPPGIVLLPASTPCVFSIAVRKSRKSTGGPSVRKYAWPPCPFSAASSSPSTQLATWQVDVL
jgi:hypothetical protein